MRPAQLREGYPGSGPDDSETAQKPTGHCASEPSRRPRQLNPALAGYSERPRDQHSLHLRGALADLKYLRVTVEPAARALVHEPGAAEDLSGVAGIIHCRVRRDQLGDRRLLLERRPGDEPGGGV